LAWSLRQRAFHGLDAQHVIGMVRDHGDANYSHPLYLPLMHAWHGLLAPLGLSPFASLRLASAVGVGLGAGALHRAGLALRLARTDAAAAVALACATPAVLFFATVVELHGVFFAFAGIACWAWARAVAPEDDRGRYGRFALLGVATAVAAGVHSSGHALLWLFLLLTLDVTAARRRRWSGFAAVFASHLALTVALSAFLGRGGGGNHPWRQLVDFALQYWGPRVPWHPLDVLGLFAREWFVPFLPLSAATLAALAVPAARRSALAVLGGIVPLLGMVWLLLHRELYERGAYLLPFAWPGALLVVRWWPRWGQVLGLGVALAIAIGQIVRHDVVHDDPDLPRLQAALDAGPALLLCLDEPEVEQALRDLPEVTPRPVAWLSGAVAQGYGALCAEFDAWVAPFLDTGRPVWITARAREYMAAVGVAAVRQFVADYLPQRYAFETRAGLAAQRLRRR